MSSDLALRCQSNTQEEHGQKAMWVGELQRAAGDKEEAVARREDARKGEIGDESHR